MTQKQTVGIATVLLALCGACEAPDRSPPERSGTQAVGKADAPSGSCDAATCGGIGNGGCWCDEECAAYGDCCADAAQVCGVDECDVTADACAAGESCQDIEGLFECAAPMCGARLGEGTVECPPQSRLAGNNAGLAFCLREDLGPAEAAAACAEQSLPPGAEPYCTYVDDGYFGYYWDACPAGTVASVGPGGEQRCGLEPSPLPAGAKAYCNYIEDGYFGYYWDLDAAPDHVCPEHTRSAPNGQGTGFCLIEYDAMPGPVRAWCDPAADFLGYEWGVDCAP